MLGAPYAGVRRESLIGLIAIALPLYLLLSTPVFHAGVTGTSISAHYYSDKRDMFIFALILIGIFQFRYQGTTRREMTVSAAAGVAAVCVGFFPTTPQSPSTYDTFIGVVHFGSAAVLFGLQAFYCFTFARRTSSRTRSGVYMLFGASIMASMAGIVAVSVAGTGDASWRPVFWLEAVALFAFGCSWLLSILRPGVSPLDAWFTQVEQTEST